VTTEGAAGGERVVSPKQAQLMFQGKKKETVHLSFPPEGGRAAEAF
jgi:hypothetical protein